MPTQVQTRRGTTTQHSSFTGAAGELTVDTDKKTVVVHDGSTAGGAPLLRENQSNLPTSAPTTGIYNASGSLAISTNSTGRLFVDSSGRVGVGTNSPAAILHSVQLASNAVSETLRLQNSSDGLSAGTELVFASNNTAHVKIQQLVTGSTAGNRGSDCLFFTKADGGSISERMRLDSSGKLGVGNSSPSDVLHVEGTIRTSSGSNNAQFANNFLRSNQAGTFYFDQNSGSQDFAFRLSNVTNLDTTAMTIKPSGRVGIGTSSPSAALHVSAASGPVTCRVTSGSSSVDLSQVGVDTYLSNAANGTMQFWVNSGEKVRIDSSGRVGIGTTSVDGAAKAAISKGGAEGFEFRVGDTAGVCEVVTYNRSGGAYTDLRYDSATHQFKIGGNERARLDSSGRLLVGTSTVRDAANASQSTRSPLYFIEGAGGSAFSLFTGILGRADENGPNFTFAKTRSNSIGANTIVQNGDSLGSISFAGADGTDLNSVGASITAQVDGTPGVDDMPGRLVFSTCPDSGSSPVERIRVDSVGRFLLDGSDAFSGNTFAVVPKYSQGAASALFNRPTTANTTTAVYFRDGNTNVGTISYTNSSTAYNTSSDYRLKENVVTVTDGITRLQQLKPSRFNFIADPAKTVDGFIAHEVQDVVPEAITGEKDAVDDDGNPIYQGIDQSKLVPLLTAALQEAIGRIETLEAEVAALKAQ